MTESEREAAAAASADLQRVRAALLAAMALTGGVDAEAALAWIARLMYEAYGAIDGQIVLFARDPRLESREYQLFADWVPSGADSPDMESVHGLLEAYLSVALATLVMVRHTDAIDDTGVVIIDVLDVLEP